MPKGPDRPGGAVVPDGLRQRIRAEPGGGPWLERLPGLVERYIEAWQLTLGPPLAPDATASLVLSVRRADDSTAVLKIGLPHPEARDEIAGLRFWAGNPTVRVLEADPDHCAALLERCESGECLAEEPPEVQDAVIAELLTRLWRSPPVHSPFRSLGWLMDSWAREAETTPVEWRTPERIRTARTLLSELEASPEPAVLLATDLHAGNVLRARRMPWLVIDPKPFVGDRTFDLLQHLLNHPRRILRDFQGVATGMAGSVGVDVHRLRRWLFVRIILGPVWRDPAVWSALARELEP